MPRPFVAFLFAVLFPLFSRAQDNWMSFPQDVTRANLWSIAYGNNTLVVAGEQGTILSFNYDDQAWLPRDGGTSRWLVGAGFGNGRFIVVGEGGTILTSDDSGITWTPRVSGTPARLNAVAFGNARWLAIGEQGAVLVSTDNGDTWSARPSLGSGFLRALAYGQGRFLLGGAGGALYTTTDTSAFSAVSIGTTADIEAAAISANRFWVAGSNGLRASAAEPGAWTINLAQNSDRTLRGLAVRNDEEASAVGDRIAFTYLLTPLPENRWSFAFRSPDFLATAVARAPNEVVAVGLGGNIVRSQMNSPAWIVREPPGNVVYGGEVRFQLLSGSTATSYQWLRGETAIPGATDAGLVFRNVTPADRGSYGLRFTTASGTSTLFGGASFAVVAGGRPEIRDPGFTAALPSPPTLVVTQPDGKLLVAGYFTVAPGGNPTHGLARLNRDGSLDPSFRAGEGVPELASITGLHLLANGRILVRGTFVNFAGRPLARIVRLLPTGEVDAAFNPDQTLAASIMQSAVGRDDRVYVQLAAAGDTPQRVVRLTDTGGLDPDFPAIPQARLIAVDWNGGVLVLFTFDASRPYGFTRYGPDGKRDPTYQERTISTPAGYGDPFARVVATEGGLYFASANYARFGTFYSFGKLLPDGRNDSSYTPPPTSAYPAIPRFAFAYRADGGLWQLTGNSSLNTVVAYDANGRVDRSRYATLPDLGGYEFLATSTDGSIYVNVDSATTGGSRTLARLLPRAGRPGRLTNLAVRSYVASADEPLIAGFVTTGTGFTNALIRGVGPSLSIFGVADPLADPQLSVVRNGTVIDTNDDWNTGLAPRFQEVGAFPLTASKDAALISPVVDGDFTAVVTAPRNDSGTALVELYESTDEAAPSRRFINVSARGSVTPERPLIVGFSITGEVPATVLIRAAGPGLAAFNVPGWLADPTLVLYRNNTARWDNDDWQTDAAIGAAMRATGAFTLAAKDSAMVVTLAPGSYTAVVTGANNGSGVALAEVYEVP